MQEEERVELERFTKGGRNPDGLNFDGMEYKGAAGKGGMSGSYSAIVDSPPGSSAGPPEKTWDPTGSDGISSGMPLLHNDGNATRNGLTSPVHSQSPGLPPSYPLPASPVNRGFSASPHAPSRMGSTGPGSPLQARGPGSPAPGDPYGMSRINSPGPMQLNHGPGSPGSQSPYGGNDGYWNNGGHR